MSYQVYTKVIIIIQEREVYFMSSFKKWVICVQRLDNAKISNVRNMAQVFWRPERPVLNKIYQSHGGCNTDANYFVFLGNSMSQLIIEEGNQLLHWNSDWIFSHGNRHLSCWKNKRRIKDFTCNFQLTLYILTCMWWIVSKIVSFSCWLYVWWF